MINWFRLLAAMMRRMTKRLPMLGGFAVLCLLLVGILLGVMMNAYTHSEEQTPLTVGLVGDTSESFLGIGVTTIQHFDISRFYLDFQSMDESAAKDALQRGDIVAYMVMPDHFVTDIVQGNDVDLTLVTGNTPDALGPALMREIATTVEDILIHAEKGMYGYMALQRQAGLRGEEQYEIAQDLTLLYIDSILTRDTATTFTETGIGKGVPFVSYYTAAFAIVFCLLIGLVYTGISSHREDMAFSRMAYTQGYGVFSQTMAEFLPFCMVMWLLIMLYMSAFGVMYTLLGVETSLSVRTCMIMGCALLPIAVLMAALEQFFLELLPHSLGCIPMQVLCIVLGSFASGLFYPTSALPALLRLIGEWLPTGVALSYTVDIVENRPVFNHIAVVLGYTVILVCVTALLRKRRIGCVTK